MTHEIRLLSLKERNDLNREELQSYINHLHSALDTYYHDMINHRHLAATAENKLHDLRLENSERKKENKVLMIQVKALKEELETPRSAKDIHIEALKEANEVHLETIAVLNLKLKVIKNLLLATLPASSAQNVHQAYKNLMNILTKKKEKKG